MWPDNSVLIIANALISLVYSLPPNIDWSNSQYDTDSVSQNDNILKLFLQLAVHTANYLTHLRNETDRHHNCNGHNDCITQSLPQANLERPDKNQDKIKNWPFIINSEINNNDQVLKNLDQDQTTLLNSMQSQELYNSNNFQEGTDAAYNSKASNLIPMLVRNVQNTSSDVVGYNYNIHNPDTLQKSINLNTTSNWSSVNEFSSDEQNSQNSIINDVSPRFNPINLIKNVSYAAANDFTEDINKFFPESENVQESTPEVNQRFFGFDLAKYVPGINIMNNLYENVNQLKNQWLQNIQEQLRATFFDSVIIKNVENFLNTQFVNNLPAMNQILSKAKHFIESMIMTLAEMENAKNENNLLNYIISQFQSVTDKFLKTAEKNQKYPANFNYIQQQIKNVGDNLLRIYQNLNDNSGSDINELANASEINYKKIENNNLSTNTDNSKIENNDSQSAPINDEVIKSEAFEKTDEIRTNYLNKQLNPISKNLFQRNDTNESLKDFSIERLFNQLESDPSRISSITEYQDKNSNTQDLQDSENMNKFNVEKPKELQDNPSTNIRISRSIGNRNIPIDNDLLKLNNSRFVGNLKDANLHGQLPETKLKISDRLINALLPITKEKISNSESHVIII